MHPISRIFNPRTKFLDNQGNPVSGGSITLFVNRTSVKASVFSDSDLTIPQSNPYDLDSSGRTKGDLWFGSTVSIQVNDINGAQIRIDDDIEPVSSPSTVVLPTDTVATMVADTKWNLGDSIVVEDYATGNNSGVLFFKVVAAGTGTADGGSFIDLPNTTPALQAKQNFPYFITTKSFGATGNGAANDTVPTQATITYTNTKGGGRIIAPPGRYKITAPLIFSGHGVTFEGAAMGPTNDQVGDPRVPAVVFEYEGASATACFEIQPNIYGVYIKNLTIKETATIRTTRAIRYNGRNGAIQDIFIHGFEMGIMSNEGQSFSIDRLNIGIPSNTGTLYAVMLNGLADGFSGTVSKVVINDSKIVNCQVGLFTFNCLTVTVNGTGFENAQQPVLDATVKSAALDLGGFAGGGGDTFATIDDCYFENNLRIYYLRSLDQQLKNVTIKNSYMGVNTGEQGISTFDSDNTGTNTPIVKADGMLTLLDNNWTGTAITDNDNKILDFGYKSSNQRERLRIQGAKIPFPRNDASDFYSGEYSFSAPKAWVKFSVTGTTPTIIQDHNVISVTRVSTGIYNINLNCTFDTSHMVTGQAEKTGFADGQFMHSVEASATAGVCQIKMPLGNGGTLSEPNFVSVVIY